MAEIVVDASALLALLNAEQGSEVVAEALQGAVVSTVNLSEVVAKLCDAGMPAKAVRQALPSLGLKVEPFDEEQAYAAGFLRDATKSAGLSLGDRCCLGLAQTLGVPVLTADKTWAELPLKVTVKVIR